MDALVTLYPIWIWAFAFAVALAAGLIKGIVGFAMPMILISGLGSVMSPELALAGLILPTLVTNAWQALRQGGQAAWGSLKRYRVFLLAGFVVMMLSAQLVPVLPERVLFLLIGVPIVLFAARNLAGRHLRVGRTLGRRAEALLGAVAGFFGGISGIWGPPTVAMLTAQNTEKRDSLRIQGVIYAMGAVALLGAHIGSGVLRAQTLPLSLLLVVPAMAGMFAGFYVQDRLNQAQFRRLTLFVLLIAGLNLIRRGF